MRVDNLILQEPPFVHNHGPTPRKSRICTYTRGGRIYTYIVAVCVSTYTCERATRA